LLWAAWGLTAPAQAQSDLAGRLRPIIAGHEGEVAVAVKHLATGDTFAHRDDQPMPTASLIKLAVMIEAYRQAHEGQLDLARHVELRGEDKVPGSGILTPHFSPGTTLSVRDAIRLMIAYSDNTATNLVLDQIGLAATSETMERLGCPNTKIHAKVFRRETSIFPERSAQFGLGSTTAAEMVRLLELLYRRELVSRQACDDMLEHLVACEDRTQLAALLPEGTKFPHKTGAVSAVRTDAGIIFSPGGPIAVCVLTANNKDQRAIPDNAAQRLMGRIGQAVYQHFGSQNPPDRSPPAAIALRVGATGQLVQALQRTLNKRLRPSPELAVDGDFGPATESAVKRWQQSQALPATGEVDERTWQTLGPLAESEEPVPDPEVVNSRPLPRQPPEKLDGPPLTTCPAWAIGDARSGNLLWGAEADQPRDMASTTKIMTAYVVLRFAHNDPQVLQEQVVFSQRADDTTGTTCDLRAGEKVAVGELLYGLLLPSGNDAAVALAEHFGPRCEPPADRPAETDPLARFVAEMNRVAQRLGLKETQYRNPHGLTEKGHATSPRDLLRLAAAAWQEERFRVYVGTRQRGCRVEGPGGYQRNVLWKTTNRLLEIEGYDGVKTGTTSAAGACLVSIGKHQGKELLVVVLGSASSDARYIDTRNLFRWAWGQEE
jgi:D-alanyl-D-alanine carboxypeptidase (penicillin-binding protein 5/6)